MLAVHNVPSSCNKTSHVIRAARDGDSSSWPYRHISYLLTTSEGYYVGARRVRRNLGDSVTNIITTTALLTNNVLAIPRTVTLRTSNRCCDDGRPCITPDRTAATDCDRTPRNCRAMCARSVTHRNSHNLSDCGCSTLLVGVTRTTRTSGNFGSSTVGSRFVGGLGTVATTGIRGNCNVLANRNTSRRRNVNTHTCRHGGALFSGTTGSNNGVTCRSSNRTHTARSNRGFTHNFGTTSGGGLTGDAIAPTSPTNANRTTTFSGAPGALCFRGSRGPSNARGANRTGRHTSSCRGFIRGSTVVTNTRRAVTRGRSIGATSRSLLSRVFASSFLTGLTSNACT